jgi:uncharacterized SAM-binding protein YcdF (DUF218 family)
VFIFGKLFWAVVQPGNLLLLVLLGGFLLLLGSRGRRGRMLIGLAAIGFLVFAVAPVGPAMLLVLEQRFPRPQTLPARIDGILVLGGAVDPGLSLAYGETVFNSSVARVLAGIALARRHPEAKLALVGGEGELFPVGFAEARATSRFVVDEGITAARIILEERSRSTHENAVFAKESIRPGPAETWILVTSAFSYAACGRFVPCRRLAGYPLSRRFQSRSQHGLAREFQPCRRPRNGHDRRQGVGRARRLPAARLDGRVFPVGGYTLRLTSR